MSVLCKHSEGVPMIYLVTLSNEWNTIEFLHMAIATALLPFARQYVLMKSRFDCGATHITKSSRRFTK